MNSFAVRKPEAAAVEAPRSRWTTVDYVNGALVATLCVVFMILRWKKMVSLLWLDPAHWLNEISRFAGGELPYRDYSYQYPPFAIFLYGYLLRAFGASFTAVQVITDIIDVGVIACCYAVIRKLLPRSLHVVVACLLLCVCATSLMNFNVFSFVTYSPTLQTGALGVFLLVLGLATYIRTQHFGRGAWLMLAAGGFIAVLSKPESALASVCVTAIFALIVRRPGLIAIVGLVVFVPAAIAYAFIAAAVGSSNLLSGMSGYGLATAFCPWWPTGVGLFGVMAAVGEASAVAAVVTFPRWRSFTGLYGRWFTYLLWFAPIGVMIFAGYVAMQSHDALFSPGLTLAERIRRTLPYVIYTTPVMQPMLWVCIAAFVFLLWRVLLTPKAHPTDATLLLFVSAPVIMSSRGLFGSTQGIVPETPGICYPFLLVLGPYLLWRFLRPAGNSYATRVVVCLALGYALIRTVGGWPDMLSDRHYGTLQTERGTVKLLNYDIDSRVYGYVMSHTSPDDYVLDLPYGGGLNFASRRRFPIFNVQLSGLGVPAHFEQLDMELIRKRPPRFVIGLDEPNLGTYWGFGGGGSRACVCPRLVWAPERRAWDTNHVLPVATYIQQNYRVVQRIGDRLIWAPKNTPLA